MAKRTRCLSRVSAKKRLRQVADYLRAEAFGFGFGDVHEVMDEYPSDPAVGGKPGHGVRQVRIEPADTNAWSRIWDVVEGTVMLPAPDYVLVASCNHRGLLLREVPLLSSSRN